MIIIWLNIIIWSMTLISGLESLLFVASKPLAMKEIVKALNVAVAEIEPAVAGLKEKFNTSESGIQIIDTGSAIQMVTNPENSAVVEKFTKRELMGELTRAQLETLTVIAYQGPMTRPELEQIRGVNCAIILRNLEMRGLIEEEESADKLMSVYCLSADALRYLGIASPRDLPDYTELHNHLPLELKENT